MKISMILPVYNEATILQEVLNKYVVDLKAAGNYEIIAVNDGSTDGSGEILLNAAKLNRNLRVINLDGRFGKQAAITAGFAAIGGDTTAVITADVDILNPTGIIKRVIDEFEGGATIVYARRENLGFDKTKAKMSDATTKFAAKLFGVDGKYTGKANVALYSRAIADVISAIPERNKYMRQMDNWTGWEIRYVDYASGYNKTEEHRKIAECKSKTDNHAVAPSRVRRDGIREHTPSIDLSWGFLVASVIMFVLGIVLSTTGYFDAWVDVLVWLVAALFLAVALMFHLRAVLIKRVGVLYTTKSDAIYVVKNVVN